MKEILQLLIATFLADAKKAVLPDVVTYLSYIAKNGVDINGLPLATKALTAVEADGVAALNQFIKDAAGIILAHITAAQTSAPVQTKPAA